jgi:acyl carrier protein
MNSLRSCNQVMPKDQFLRHIEKILDIEPNALLGPECLSDTKEWDSTAIIDFMAMVDKHAGAILSVDAIVSCATYDDLFALIEN